jgi:hypothetical protein
MQPRHRKLVDQRAAIAQRADRVAAHNQLPHIATALRNDNFGQ